MENRENHGPALQADYEALAAAWDWLCAARKSAPADADIWDLRFHWEAIRTDFLQQLQTGEYRLSPMRVTGRNKLMMWTAGDALALKWLALRLQGQLPLHEKCEHVKGHGGGKSSVVRLSSAVQTGEYPWVCRTDIRGYYGSVDKARLLSQLKQHITRPAYLSLLEQYLYYSTEDGGEFHTPEKGIARGCALSPLMGALHLWVVDDYFARQKNIRYARYMDDFVILAKSRWSLRRQVKALNRRLSDFGFVKHPDKTFIGRVQRGFDWLGAWLTDRGVTGVAPRALKNYHDNVRRLYELTRRWPKEKRAKRVSDYRRRWLAWGGCLCFIAPLTTISEAAVIDVTRGEGFVSLKTGVSLSGVNTSACGSTPNTFYTSTLGSSGESVGFSSDGKAYGVLVPGSVDMYVVLNGSGTVMGDLRHTATITWKNNGPVTWAGGDSATYYFEGGPGQGSRYMAVGTSAYADWPLGNTTTGSVNSALYVGPNTVPGSYALYGYRTYIGCGAGSAKIVETGTTVHVTALECHVNAPPVVDFGRINLHDVPGANSLLSTSHEGLTVTCTGSVPSAAITAVGDTYDGYNYRLGMFNDVSGAPAAYLRSRTGTYSGSCEGTDTELNFIGTAGKSVIDALHGGPNYIPLTWSLCSISSKVYGAASAQATITINWD